MKKLARQKILFILLVTLSFGIHQVSNARWATKDDVQTEYESYEQNIKVNKDGTFEVTGEFTQKLLKEGARMYLSKYEIVYKGEIEEIKIIDAKTIHKGKEYKVDKKLIENKPLASEAGGFDQLYQISIPFQKVEVGSKIYLKYHCKYKKVPVKNHYSEIIGFRGDYYNKSKTTIKSEIPLHIKVNDPHNVLKVTQKNEKDIQIEVIKPFTDKTINDVSHGILNSKNKTWVSISSSDNWNKIAKPYVKGYKKVINQKLPNKFKEIAELASKEKSEIDKINKVTSLIQDNMHYLKDWKTADGGWYPRDLKVIESTQYGDCKDFSTITVAILNSIGFDGNVALVYRGEINYEVKDRLPGVQFNHAIVHVKSKTGKEYWIDPTNVVSMAGKIFPDIADRMALILDDGDDVYKKIGTADYKTSSSTVNADINIKGDTVNKDVKVHILGERASPFTVTGLFLSKGVIEDKFYSIIERGQLVEKKKRKKSIIPDLKSRIVSDINFQLEYGQDNQFTKTNYGKSLKLYTAGVPDFLSEVPSDSVKDFYIGQPSTFVRARKINYPLKNIKNLNFNASSPWFNISRTCKIKDGNTIIEDKVEKLKSYITYEERQQKSYKEFKNNVEQNFSNVSIIPPQ